MMRASHSSYWSFRGGWRASISLKSAGHEFGLAPARKVAAHQRVEIVLERADLVSRPFVGQGGESIGRGAGAVMVEGRGVTPERNVDGKGDLLDRAHAVEPMGAEVAWQIEELDGSAKSRVPVYLLVPRLCGSPFEKARPARAQAHQRPRR
jgi:hypothetical protein